MRSGSGSGTRGDGVTKVGILISGRGSNMMALVEQAQGYTVALVASDKPDAAGLAWAQAHGIATFALSPKGIGKAAYEAALDAALRDAGVGTIALAGYMRLLSDDFVARWRGRIVNIHPSLLPRYKGLDTHARAIAAADAVAGCSVHVVTEELDGGDVLGQAEGEDRARRYPRYAVRARPRRGAWPLSAYSVRFRRTMSPDPTKDLARIRDLCLALPEAAERTSHGAPGFQIEGGRFFAYFWHDHHADDETVVIVKTSGAEEQAMLIEMDPDCYFKPAYLGPSGWVAMRLDRPGHRLGPDRRPDRDQLGTGRPAPPARGGRTMTDTPAERADAARTRRRWVSLAEVVALAGLLIGALSLYTTWSDHPHGRTGACPGGSVGGAGKGPVRPARAGVAQWRYDRAVARRTSRTARCATGVPDSTCHRSQGCGGPDDRSRLVRAAAARRDGGQKRRSGRTAARAGHLHLWRRRCRSDEDRHLRHRLADAGPVPARAVR